MTLWRLRWGSGELIFVDNNPSLIGYNVSCERVGVIGLHTCGDLAPSSLNTFLQSPGAALLCNVGCCYNHLTSEGFPLSQHVRDSGYQVWQAL